MPLLWHIKTEKKSNFNNPEKLRKGKFSIQKCRKDKSDLINQTSFFDNKPNQKDKMILAYMKLQAEKKEY